MRVIGLPGHICGVIFDVDRTLYTNERYAEYQVEVLVERLGAEFGKSIEETWNLVRSWRKEYARTHDGARQSLGNTFLGLGIPIEQSVQWREELISPEEHLRPDARLAETIEKLRVACRLVVVTNNPASIGRRTLSALGIESLIDAVVGLDSTGKSKPDTEPFRFAASLLGCAPEFVVSIGDRLDVDIVPARKLGMGGILVDGVEDTYRVPEIILEKSGRD